MGLIKLIMTGTSKADEQRKERDRGNAVKEVAKYERMAKEHRAKAAAYRKHLNSGHCTDESGYRYLLNHEESNAESCDESAAFYRTYSRR